MQADKLDYSTVEIPDAYRLIDPKKAAEIAGGYHHLSLKRIQGFPRPVRLASNKNGYVLGEVLAWVEQRKAERSA